MERFLTITREHSIKFTHAILAITALLLWVGTSFAAPLDERSEIENLKKRIEALEAEKAEPKGAFAIEKFSDRLRLGGLLE